MYFCGNYYNNLKVVCPAVKATDVTNGHRPQISKINAYMPIYLVKTMSTSYKMIKHSIPIGKSLPLTPIVSFMLLIPISDE